MINVLTSNIEDAIADGSYNFLNPLDPSPAHQAAILSTSATLFRDIETEFNSFGITLDGAFLDLPAGQIGWAAGFAWACKYTPVSHASLYLAASPIWGLLLEERPRLNQESIGKYFAALLALSGIIVLFWPKLLVSETGDNKWIGDLIAFAASWSWTIYSRESRRLSVRISGMTYTAHTAWRASLLMVPFVAWEFTRELPRLESNLIGWQFFSIFAGTIVGLGIWNNALRYWPTSRALLFNNLIPIFTMLWAWSCLNEPMTSTFWLAMGLVITGVVIGLAPWRKKQGE